ncbi:MAG: hypothetical protein V3T24_04435 [Longimicrobiales bacterium]
MRDGSVRQEAKPSVSPRGGPPGTEVTVRWTGLSPDSAILIGFGGLGSGYEIVGESGTDANGDFSHTVRVPAWAERDESHFFFVAYEDGQPRGISDAFHVTGPDGTLRLEGRITDEGVACTAMRGENDELYMLVGETERLSPGDRVVVEGTIADASACQQGLAIAVTEIRGG